jgi:hypothetical protein
VVAAIWVIAGLILAGMVLADYPQFAARGYAAAAGAGLLLALLHSLLLLIFRSPAAAIGMLAGKGIALPVTAMAGFWGFILFVFSTDSGMEAAAEAAWMTVPICMLIPALPSLLGALIGAAVGQAIHRRRSQSQLQTA